MNVTGWSRCLEVTGGGQGIVSHAGLVLLRALADRTGLTAGLSKALASRRLLIHDRGQVLADLACAIADGAEVISDFRVMADQQELFGLAASVPTCWRVLSEIAGGGSRPLARVTVTVNGARRRAWAQIVARHGGLPGVAMADKVAEGVTCIRLDATVTPAHSDKELAEPNYKGFGHHPLLAYCDNTSEPLAGTLRRGSAGSNTVADHLQVLDAAITALPPAFRRRLMVTCDGAGASHGLIARLDALAARPGHQLIYSVGWDLGERERTAIHLVSGHAWQAAVDHRGEVRERRADDACTDASCSHRTCWVEEAHVAELTALLRDGRAGDQLAGWPPSMRVFARRERPHPGAQLTLLKPKTAGATPVGDQPARPHARLARPARLYRRRPPGPCTGGGLRPHRQRHRHRPLPQPGVRAEPGLACRRADRRPPCWPGCATSPWTATWPKPNRKHCATAFCTPPPASRAAAARGV